MSYLNLFFYFFICVSVCVCVCGGGGGGGGSVWGGGGGGQFAQFTLSSAYGKRVCLHCLFINKEYQIRNSLHFTVANKQVSKEIMRHGIVHVGWEWPIFSPVNSSHREKNGLRFADAIFRCLFTNEHFYISIIMSRKFGPKIPIDNNPALVYIIYIYTALGGMTDKTDKTDNFATFLIGRNILSKH